MSEVEVTREDREAAAAAVDGVCALMIPEKQAEWIATGSSDWNGWEGAKGQHERVAQAIAKARMDGEKRGYARGYSEALLLCGERKEGDVT